MNRTIALRPITAAAFAPFGQILPPRLPGAGRVELIDELENRRGSARPRLALVAVIATPLPLQVTEMERHRHSSQAFVPLDCASYLVLVAPPGADGLPDARRLAAFRVPGDTAINYAVDTWHHPLAALERTARFAVLTFVDGTPDDEQFVPLAEPVSITA